MSGTKIDIHWSPADNDLFITSGSAITLYSVKDEVETDQGSGPDDKLTKTSIITQVDSKADLPLMKCVSWCPKRDQKNVFAVAQTNGRINITGFGESTDDLIGKEFNVRYNRQCNYLSWNPQETNLLAQGLERYRNEPCILIWDVMREITIDMSERSRHSFSEGPLTKPFCETGGGEASYSFSWFPEDPKVFLTGMSGKHIRVYDVRDTTKHRSAANHRCVAGVSIDPTDRMRVVSYLEDVVAIWDLRSFDKPISLITENKAVMKVSWCPSRSGILSVLCKDSSYVKLHDIRLALFGSDDLEQTYIARNIQPRPRSTLSSFCWHPWPENKMMTVMPNGHLKDLVIFERMPVNWSSNLKLAMPVREDKIDCTRSEPDDIAALMKKRVKLRYGMDHQNVEANMKAIENEKHLHGLWKWLYNIRALDTQNKDAASGQGKSKVKVSLSMGILAMLHLEESSLNSDISLMQWVANPNESVNYTHKRTYRSPERSLALQMCGWSPDQDRKSIQAFICSLVAAQEVERAAALALFNLHIKLALDILSNSDKHDSPDKSTRQAVAMALSGYTEEKNTLWHNTCDALRSQLSHPYLRAIFAFLATEDDNYEEVLSSISVEDRIAFALIYLPDHKLKTYLLKLCEELTERGNLDVIILTGLSSRGINLLSRYMDLTSDVQTVALASVFSASLNVIENVRVGVWIEAYRDLLDRWKLWHERACFDIIKQNLIQDFKVPPQILVTCTFCGKSVTSNTLLTSKYRTSIMPRSTHNRFKVNCCQGCRKAFPRCSICLNNMGTFSGAGIRIDLNEGEKLSPLEEWFTWCQTCRHGGHAGHITQWFREHRECPVTACNCECVSQDCLT